MSDSVLQGRGSCQKEPLSFNALIISMTYSRMWDT